MPPEYRDPLLTAWCQETFAEARTIQAFSGYKSKEMVWRYMHTRDQRTDEALDRFDKGETKVEQIERKKRPRS